MRKMFSSILVFLVVLLSFAGAAFAGAKRGDIPSYSVVPYATGAPPSVDQRTAQTGILNTFDIGITKTAGIGAVGSNGLARTAQELIAILLALDAGMAINVSEPPILWNIGRPAAIGLNFDYMTRMRRSQEDIGRSGSPPAFNLTL